MLVRGVVKFVPAVAYHFRLSLPAAFTQPRTRIIFQPSIGSLSHLRTMLPESSSCPQPAQRPNHAT